MRSLKVCAIAAATSIILSACTTSEPVVFEGLSSAPDLRPDQSDSSGKIPYSFRTVVDWKQYQRIAIENVVIYRGRDAQFGKTSEEDKQKLAAYMQMKFAEAIGQKFSVGTSPGPATLSLRLTLTGAETTDPVLGPVSHVDMAGGVYNTVQAARGKQGSMTGSATFAVEIHDASSGRLLLAYVSKQYPGALNLGAAFGTLSASYLALDKGAADLVERIN